MGLNKQGLAAYINHFYNRPRMHTGIGYRSPDEYENMAARSDTVSTFECEDHAGDSASCFLLFR
jgi:hypothetical protein